MPASPRDGLAAVAACLAIGYACGSLPWGLWLPRVLKGVDVRTLGSGNLGATNVYRTLGPPLGVAVLLLDAAKGALPVWLVPRLGLAAAFPGGAEWCRIVVGSAAVLGHNYPNSEWYGHAYALLKSGGASPQINQGTWLSNTLKALTPGGSQQKKPEPKAAPQPAPGLPAPEDMPAPRVPSDVPTASAPGKPPMGFAQSEWTTQVGR